jgi:hypothetical protein
MLGDPENEELFPRMRVTGKPLERIDVLGRRDGAKSQWPMAVPDSGLDYVRITVPCITN